MTLFQKKSKEIKKKEFEYRLYFKCKCGFKVPEWRYKDQKIKSLPMYIDDRSICPKCGGLTNQFEKKIIKEEV